MEKIRSVFLVTGSVLLGVGMVWAGLIRMSGNDFAAGVAYIAGAVGLIALCVFVFFYGNRTPK
ncbi:MAG: hypothetical protein K6T66_10630 [Peptococcaceae bacterium]|nr:hypothetical protein [Peptococcaceae bacterium]